MPSKVTRTSQVGGDAESRKRILDRLAIVPTPNIIKVPTREVRILMRHVRLRAAGIRIDRSLPRPAGRRAGDDASVAF